MYLPPPLTGALTDRYGPTTTAVASGLTLLAAGAAAAPADSVLLLTLALVLLGIGWNLGLVSGTTLITDADPLATRAKTQGIVDVAIAIAGATGGMASGVVVAAGSYPLLALTGAVLALALLPRSSSPRGSAHPTRDAMCRAAAVRRGQRRHASGGVSQEGAGRGGAVLDATRRRRREATVVDGTRSGTGPLPDVGLRSGRTGVPAGPS